MQCCLLPKVSYNTTLIKKNVYMAPADMKSISAQIKTTTPNKINDQQHLCSMQRPQHPQQGIHISINTKLKCLPRSPRATRHLHEYIIVCKWGLVINVGNRSSIHTRIGIVLAIKWINFSSAFTYIYKQVFTAMKEKAFHVPKHFIPSNK